MKKLTHQTRSFDGFILDLTRGCLLHGDEEVKLRPKSFEVLKYLVESSGRLVSKDELIGAVWRNTFVTDNSLVQCLIEIRRALGDEAQHYVKTVPRRGYIFESQVGENIPAIDVAVYTEQVEGLKVVIEEEEETNDREVATGHLKSAAEYLTSKSKGHRRAVPLLLAMLLMLGAGFAFGIYKFIDQDRSGAKPVAPHTIKISRLTNTGKAADAAISPDGKYVIHVVETAAQQSLWMRQVSTASNVQIVPPLDVEYAGMTFSGDGNYLYYSVWDKKNPGPAVLYQMPVLGGPSRKLVVDIDSVITFSPDSKRFAFLRGYPPQGESALIVAKADGTADQKLAIRKGLDFFSAQGDAPAWSPDGKVIACPAGGADLGGPYMTVLEVRVADGTTRPITARRWFQVGRMAWLRDGNGLIFTAREQESSPSQLWYLSYPGGEVHRITNDLNDYDGVSLTADATALVTVQSDLRSNIWLAPGGDARHATQLPSNNFDGVEGISWTPDGKIVYASRADGNSDIWIMNQDGTGQNQLTEDAGNNSWPSVSADGRYIVFMSDREGAHYIWRMDKDGKNPQQLTNGGNEWYPDCSPYGQWVVYRTSFGKHTLWKISINGGNSVQVNDKASACPAMSPDSKWVACAYFEDPERIKTAIYRFEGGEPSRILDIWASYVRWTPDGRALAYIDQRSFSNIRSQPIDGGPAKQLTDFKSGRVFRFDWSRDGKQLALARGTLTNDVVLMRLAP